MKIDHVSVGWSDLRSLEDHFLAAGMKTEYGGPHSSGMTHMSLLGFEDGSYFELISEVRPGMRPGIWEKQIEDNGGPCAWAIMVEDIAREVARAKELGIPASGPSDYSRKRPDGVLVEWQLGFLGEAQPGAVLPFMIKDTTPREYRVKPSPSVAGPGTLLHGVKTVVLGTRDFDGTIRLFRRLYGWDEPEIGAGFIAGARLASFPDTPVVVAAADGDSWLSERLRMFGASPCAFLIESKDLVAGSKRYPLEPSIPWFGGKSIAWLRPLKEHGIMIGLVG